MEGSAVVCVIMSGIALEQMGDFQLNYMEATFTFPFCLRMYSLCLVDFKLLVYHQISKLNLVPSNGTGWGGHHTECQN